MVRIPTNLSRAITVLTLDAGILTDGGFAEYATLRREAICSVPTDLKPSEVAPLFCAGVTVFSSCLHLIKFASADYGCADSLRNMDAKPGDAVAIYGIGYVTYYTNSGTLVSPLRHAADLDTLLFSMPMLWVSTRSPFRARIQSANLQRSSAPTSTSTPVQMMLQRLCTLAVA